MIVEAGAASPHQIVSSPWPFFAILALAVILGQAIARTPFYRDLLARQGGGRYGTIDGLRGFLALAVFLHHCVVQQQYMITGVWKWPPTHFYFMAGVVPVQIFFMITGFLFWTNAIEGGARMDARKLLKSRFFRIAPLYLCSVVLVLVIVLAGTGLVRQAPFSSFVKAFGRAATLGLLKVAEFNGVNTLPINASVSWTLRDEWAFYLSLLVLAWFAKPWRFALLAAACLAGLTFEHGPGVESLFYFLPGMAAAHLAQRWPRLAWVESRWFAVVPIALTVLIFSPITMPPLARGALLVFPLFLCFLYGNDLFGLLRQPGALVLGNASYSIYLLHAPVLYVFVQLGNRLQPVTSMPEWEYWALCSGASLAVVGFSTLTFALIEHPFIARSHRKPLADGASPPVAIQA